MASSSSTAIIVVVVAAAAAAGGYFVGHQGASSPGGAMPTMAAPATASKSPVVAKVNGEPIYQSEIDAFIADLGDQAKQMAPADLQAKVIDRMVDIKLANQKAVAEKFEQDPLVAQRLRNGQVTTMAEAYLERNAKARITDDVLKAKYDDLVKQVTPPEEVHARHILVKTEAEAKDIIKQLDKGGDFEKLAKEKSTDPGSGESGGDLGYFTKDKMVPEFADAAFKMEKGKYSAEPVHSQYGWHVIQVLDKRSQPLPAFDQVKPQLTGLVLQDEERKVVEDMHKGAKVEKFNPDGTPAVDKPAAPPMDTPSVTAAPAPAPAPTPAPAPVTAPPAPAKK